jgi:hypothetical protein
MTDFTPITPRCSDEGLSVAHTATSRLFIAVLHDLEALIAAERLLQRGVAVVCDPQFDAHLTATELARDELMARLSLLIAAPERRGMDRPLRLMGVVLRMVLSVEADADRMHLFSTLVENSPLVVIRGAHPVARMVRALTYLFFEGVSALMALEDFGGPGHDPDAGMMAISA